ncbi:MAG: carbohydrate binding domain-containing protein [Sedimentisphaerales bacterium]|nr:carbohydrate binding domain-containing protein [Sedimentisphaerales bacterium]
MMGKSIWVCLSLVVIYSGMPVYGSANVLENPGFESGTTGWSARGCSINTVTWPVAGGSYSGRAFDRNAGTQGIQQDMMGKMVIGENYQISGWVRTVNAASDKIDIAIEITDSSGTDYYTIDSVPAVNSKWTKFSGNYTLRVDGALTELLLYFDGPDAGVNFCVDNVVVYGPETGTSNPDAVCQINVNTRYQVIEGFGAAGAWYENFLTAHPLKETLYNILFKELGLDIYRLRNVYDQGNPGYLSRSAEIIAAGEAALGRPLKIMISCWSPPVYLKSNDSLNGGTLKKDTSGQYMYDELAEWWADSLEVWSGTYGVQADYINIQNEPDYETDWDSCRYSGRQSYWWPGYNQAFEAVWQELNSRMGSGMPKMLAAEATGLLSSYTYLDNITNYSHVYGYSHHLYNINSGQNPDDYISYMTSFASEYGDRPIFQTEYEASTGSWPDALNLALLLHNSLTVEGVSGYLYWDLFWGESGGLVTLPSMGSSDYIINSDYYGFKHYSAFIHSGWQRVYASENASDLRMSAYISPDNQDLTVVLINTSPDTSIDADISYTGFSNADAEFYRTNQSNNCVKVGSYNEISQLTIQPRMIITLALSETVHDTTPPPAPTALEATAGETYIFLDWNDTGGDLAGYNLYRSTTSGSDYNKLNGSLLSSSYYNDTSTESGVTYYYVVTMVDNSSYESGYSNEAGATSTNSSPPAAPTGLTATPVEEIILLDWNSNLESDLAGYNVYRSTTSGSGYTQINTSLVSNSIYNDIAPLTNGITYYYVVTAVDEELNESGYSNEDSASAIFPMHYEDFESGFGDWVNMTGIDSHDWTRNSGDTSSAYTGPDNGALSSTWYVYLECSSEDGGAFNPGDTAILESPEIEEAMDRVMMFYYHMYGDDIGTLSVDVHDGAWHYGIWSRSGQQHVSSTAPYTRAIVDLSAYSGPIRIRFRAVAAGSYRGDMAIDNIEIAGIPPQALYGDFTGDNIVDMNDLPAFLGYWLASDCGEIDLNGDCVINLHEYSEFAKNWLLD